MTVWPDTLPDVAALPAGELRLRVVNAGVDAPLDVAALPSTPAADLAIAGTVRGVPAAGRSPYVALPAIAEAAQLYRFTVQHATAVTTLASGRPNLPGLPYTAASAAGPALDPVAGVRQGRSVLSLVVFPAAVAGPPAATAVTATVTVTVTVDLLPDRMPPAPR